LGEERHHFPPLHSWLVPHGLWRPLPSLGSLDVSHMWLICDVFWNLTFSKGKTRGQPHFFMNECYVMWKNCARIALYKKSSANILFIIIAPYHLWGNTSIFLLSQPSWSLSLSCAMLGNGLLWMILLILDGYFYN